MRLLRSLADDGKKVVGYGASTKGNVVLQFCGITPAEVPVIAEVNADKFGSYTPGTNIPIVSEAEARAMQPDYFVVLPMAFQGRTCRARGRVPGQRRPYDLSVPGDRNRLTPFG